VTSEPYSTMRVAVVLPAPLMSRSSKILQRSSKNRGNGGDVFLFVQLDFGPKSSLLRTGLHHSFLALQEYICIVTALLAANSIVSVKNV
jgi:hypothetical protein